MSHPSTFSKLGSGAALLAVPVILLLLGVGCQEPNYRTEVTGNGEGGVDIHRVPKDPSETTAQPTPEPSKSSLEQRVEVLEATVLRQQEEIATLHRDLNAAHPTTTAP
jgi:hypothetical protein